MQIKNIFSVYFSATGTTKTVVERLAQNMSASLGPVPQTRDFTLPQARTQQYTFGPEDLVLVGLPVYAGRLPNLLLPFLQTGLTGGGALAVPVVLFGNRNFDDALIELRNILEEHGFHTVAGAAFVGEHSFSTTLGAHRPDADDLAQADAFAAQLAEKVQQLSAAPTQPATVEGETPIRPYYTPRDRHGVPINILKVKPKTSDACDHCGLCAAICPMGAISIEDPAQVPGKCIKCGACVKRCPRGAKYYDDAGYLYHKSELEEQYARRAAVKLFL